MRGLDAIVFDFDGVIADSERIHLRAYQDVLAPLGVALSTDDYFGRYLGYDDVGVLRRVSWDRELAWDEETIGRLVAAKSARYEELAACGAMLFPGATDFIRLASAEVPIAIASGALTHEIHEILDRVSLRGAFTAIVGADQTSRSKPSPDPYLEAVRRIAAAGHQVAPARTVAIEDSVWGLVSARTAGLRCVAVTTTYEAGELQPHAELVVAGLHALTLDALVTLVEEPARPRRPSA